MARATLKGMTQSNLNAVEKTIGKKLKVNLNKEVKDAILDVAHCEELFKLNCQHRTQCVLPVVEMIHKSKPTMDKLIGTAHGIKVGSWVEVLYEYAPGICLDGGVGEVFAIRHDEDGAA